MRIFFLVGRFCILGLLAMPSAAVGFEASLDRYDITIDMNQSTALHASLRNSGPTPIYLTGVQVMLSEGASGDVYNPALLQERLHKLDPAQSWDGPLIVVRPHHRGPLLVKGSMVLKGGSTPTSSDTLASLPLQITINDPKRNADGSYDAAARPLCDRPLDHCCDLEEAGCFQIANHCLYIAEGHDSQALCNSQDRGKIYEHIADLQVSSVTAHITYMASNQCTSGSNEEHCKRIVVWDHAEQKGPHVPTHLKMSPDGEHYAYLGRSVCVTRFGEESCLGASFPVIDGKPAAHFPSWYSSK